MAVWQRDLSTSVQDSVAGLMAAHPGRRVSLTLAPEHAGQALRESLPAAPDTTALIADLALLVDMFCSLFELKRAGLRLAVIEQAMCPRFHVDWVPARLITTYAGAGTEWLPHHCVDRRRLGKGNRGLADEQSGLFRDPRDMQHLSAGDVSLMKGESWEGNEGAGLVHRSPAIAATCPRVLVTLDFLDG